MGRVWCEEERVGGDVEGFDVSSSTFGCVLDDIIMLRNQLSAFLGDSTEVQVFPRKAHDFVFNVAKHLL